MSVWPSFSSRISGASVGQRLLRVDDGRQRVVLDVDEVERVAGDVRALGDDAGDLLALEADLVGGQHRLGVAGQGRHPRQVVGRQRLAGDDGDDARQLLGRGGVSM